MIARLKPAAYHRSVLPGQGRTEGSRDWQPARWRELRIQLRTREFDRVDLHEMGGARRHDAGADGFERVQRAGLRVSATRNAGAVVRGGYASERNGDALHSNAWTLQGAYELAKVAWKPTLTYRYAFFQGDDPDTAANEAFDPLFPGFHDWGTWWQGEIAGEYFLPNSNLVSHLVRVHVSPVEAVSGGLLFFNFSLDKPGSAGPGVTATGLAFEADAYADWKVNDNFTISFVGAYADPGKAVQQITDGRRTSPMECFTSVTATDVASEEQEPWENQ